MKEITDYVIYEIEKNDTPTPVISVFADLNYDYIYESPPLEGGREVIITDFNRNIAGAGGYVSCGLAKLGAEVYLLTVLGDDEEGKELLQEIELAGVKSDGIRLVQKGRSPFTLIFTEKKEERPRQVATFMGTSEHLSIDSIDYKNFVSKSSLIYSCNYFILRRLREEMHYVFRFAREKGILTSYDANAGDGWENENALETLRERIYPLTDIVFLNEREAQFLTHTDDPASGIVNICTESTTVIIKLGEHGALTRHRNRLYRCDAFPLRDEVKDTVGAGDSFGAAFLYFYMKKFPIELCNILGAANAASTVRFQGGTIGQRNVHELVDFIKDYRIFDRGDGYISVEKK